MNNTDSKGINDTETAILKAAEHEFMTKGFSGARTTAIAEAAGVTHAMFHYYFRTKEKLFDRIINEKIKILKETLFNPVADPGLSFEDMVCKIIEQHIDFIAANPDLPRFLIGEMYASSERAMSIQNEFRKVAPSLIEGLQKKIDKAHAEGKIRKVDAGMLALDIASLNIFSFMASPIVNAAFDDAMTNREAFLSARKKNNIETIMRKLKP